ncbi:MAG: methyltransferase domain-containing protein [Verrucomicrobiota bacterium]|nr:methyltransferase domain-containing protein [Verrucomicrobiota bacterium]
MIESSNPEIDVNELMERIRREATKIPPAMSILPATRRAGLPAPPGISFPPQLGLSGPFDAKKERLEQSLRKAGGMIEVSRKIPKFLRGLFHRQSGFNHALLETIDTLTKTNLQLSKRVQELMVAARQQNDWLRTSLVPNALTLNRKMAQSEAQLEAKVAVVHEEVRDLQRRLRGTDGQMSWGERLRQLEKQMEQQTASLLGIRQDGDRQGEHLRNLQATFDRSGEHLRNLQNEFARHTQEVVRLQERAQNDAIELATVEAHLAHFAHLQQALTRLEERQANDAIYLKGEVSQHRAFLYRSLGNETSNVDKSSPTPKNGGPERDPHPLDVFYLSFENRFRGSRAEIKERVRFYLPFLREAEIGAADSPVLDVGCGRGEWLELLQENGFEASGVDLNHAMVAQCEQRNLRVTDRDALAHLRSLPGDSLGAVTGFHIIEHLPLETLVGLIAETRRVLRPGGLVIFESPNCKNLTVGACNFNVDPTHRNPIYPETAQFMLETHGFEAVNLEYLAPAANSPFNAEDPTSIALGALLYGPQDFAVIGRKPAAG